MRIGVYANYPEYGDPVVSIMALVIIKNIVCVIDKLKIFC